MHSNKLLNTDTKRNCCKLLNIILLVHKTYIKWKILKTRNTRKVLDQLLNNVNIIQEELQFKLWKLQETQKPPITQSDHNPWNDNCKNIFHICFLSYFLFSIDELLLNTSNQFNKRGWKHLQKQVQIYLKIKKWNF